MSVSDRIAFAAEPRPAARDTAPWKILVVDDDEDIQKVTRLALTGFTHYGRPITLLQARSGAEAVAQMKERGKAYDPDLLELMLKNIDRFVAITHGGS